MNEITSRKTGKIQIVSDEVWNNIIARGWARKYIMKPIVEKKLSITPPEIKKKNGKKD